MTAPLLSLPLDSSNQLSLTPHQHCSFLYYLWSWKKASKNNTASRSFVCLFFYWDFNCNHISAFVRRISHGCCSVIINKAQMGVIMKIYIFCFEFYIISSPEWIINVNIYTQNWEMNQHDVEHSIPVRQNRSSESGKKMSQKWQQKEDKHWEKCDRVKSQAAAEVWFALAIQLKRELRTEQLPRQQTRLPAEPTTAFLWVL